MIQQDGTAQQDHEGSILAGPEFWAPTQAHHDDQRQAAGEEELHRRPPADGGRDDQVCLSALGFFLQGQF